MMKHVDDCGNSFSTRFLGSSAKWLVSCERLSIISVHCAGNETRVLKTGLKTGVLLTPTEMNKMSTDLSTSVSNTLVLRNSDQSINTDGHTSCSCVNIVQRDKCADGQTRFGEACIVALLLECASEKETVSAHKDKQLYTI